MTHSQHVAPGMSAGDVAVEGLLDGMIGGVVMGTYLVVAGAAGGDAPGTVLARFDASGAGAPITGALLHLSVSGIYGIVFGLGWWLASRAPRFRRLGWLAGLLYGMALLLVAETLVLPASGSALLAIPLRDFAVAHALYGLVLGIVISRKQ